MLPWCIVPKQQSRNWPQNSTVGISRCKCSFVFLFFVMNFVVLLLQGPFNQHILTHRCCFHKSSESSSTYIPRCFGCLPNLSCFIQRCSSATLAAAAAATDVKPWQQNTLGMSKHPHHDIIAMEEQWSTFFDLQPLHHAPSTYCHPAKLLQNVPL